MTEEMTEQEAGWVTEIRTAMQQPDVRLVISLGLNFTTGGSEQGIRVERKIQSSGRWVSAGPVVYPHEEQTLGDVAKMLCDMRHGS